MGKSDRAFVFGVLGLLLGIGLPVGQFLDGIFCLMSLLLLLSCWNRARSALFRARARA